MNPRLNFWSLRTLRLTLLMLVALLFVFSRSLPAQQPPQAEDPKVGFVQSIIKTFQPRLAKVFGAGAGKVEGFSTGLVVSNDGKILTSQGVYLDGRQVRVVLHDGAEHVATILKRDRTRQLALLKIEAETPDFFELEEQPVGQKGDWVVAICNAFKVADKAEPISATLGIISLRTEMEARLTDRDVAYDGELVLIDAITSNPGASGGAVLTADGRLVGMVGKIINSSETNTRINYAVPNQILLAFLQDELPKATADTTKAVGNADLGIKLFTLGGRDAPAYIDRVLRGSPAAKAKLKSDDMIVSIDGQVVGNARQYQEAVKQLQPGEEVLVIVKRGTEVLRIRITPREKERADD